MPNSAPTHEELHVWVREARDGRASAFKALHRRFGPIVRATALCRVAASDADDVVQESFVRAWERLEQLEDPARFGPWICTIARNQCNARHRRKGLRVVSHEAQGEAVGHSPSARIDAQRALAALRELPPAYAEPLALRLVEGWTGPEIAAHMGMTHGSVRVNLHRGLKLLRERLAAPASQSPPTQAPKTQPAGEN